MSRQKVLLGVIALLATAAPSARAQDIKTAAGAKAVVLRQLNAEYRTRGGVFVMPVASDLHDLAAALDSLKDCTATSTPAGCHPPAQKVVALPRVKMVEPDTAYVTVMQFSDDGGNDRTFNMVAVILHFEQGRWKQAGVTEPKIVRHRASAGGGAQSLVVREIQAAMRTDLQKHLKDPKVVEVDSNQMDARFYSCLVKAEKRPKTCPTEGERRIARIEVLQVMGDSATGRTLVFLPHREPLEYTVTECEYSVTRASGKWVAKVTRVEVSEEEMLER